MSLQNISLYSEGWGCDSVSKVLLCKHEHLSLIPRTHICGDILCPFSNLSSTHKSWTRQYASVTPRGGRDKLLELTGQLFQPIGGLRIGEQPFSHSKVENNRERHPVSASHHTHYTRPYTHVYIYYIHAKINEYLKGKKE